LECFYVGLVLADVGERAGGRVVFVRRVGQVLPVARVVPAALPMKTKRKEERERRTRTYTYIVCSVYCKSSIIIYTQLSELTPMEGLSSVVSCYMLGPPVTRERRPMPVPRIAQLIVRSVSSYLSI
jgi:hypothetical protein